MKEKNPPAFPHETYNESTGNINGLNKGMSLRDYFAGQVLMGKAIRDLMPADYSMTGKSPTVGERIAEEAYQFADAMLKARDSNA